MPALPDGTYHPHRVRVEAIGPDVLNAVVEAVPPDGEPFMVLGFGLEPSEGPSLTEKVNREIAKLGLAIDGWGAAITTFGPPALNLHTMVLIGSTEEIDR